jgi:hypothetical protein
MLLKIDKRMTKRNEEKVSLTCRKKKIKKKKQNIKCVLTENDHILFDFSGDIPIMN